MSKRDNKVVVGLLGKLSIDCAARCSLSRSISVGASFRSFGRRARSARECRVVQRPYRTPRSILPGRICCELSRPKRCSTIHSIRILLTQCIWIEKNFKFHKYCRSNEFLSFNSIFFFLQIFLIQKIFLDYACIVCQNHVPF